MTNHDAFGSDKAKLVYGQAADGNLVHISTAKNGLACACICPGACGSRLIAKTRAATPHFAHHTLTECAGAPETALHKLAKQIIAESKTLLVPKRIAAFGSNIETLSEAKEVALDSAREEAREFSSIIPDLYVTAKSHELLVEILVTHACNDEKIAHIRNGGIAAMEIDLSRLRRDASPEEVKEAVIRGAPRKWLFNKAIEDKIDSMEKEAEASRAAKEKRLNNEALRKLKLYRDVALRPHSSSQIGCFPALRAIGIEQHIGIDVPGAACFITEPAHWQSIVLADLLFERGAGSHLIRAVGAVKFLEKQQLVRKEFQYLKRGVEAAARKIDGSFAAPWRAVETYLEYLCDSEVVMKMHHGFALRETYVSAWFEWDLEERERKAAVKHITETVNWILNEIPFEERGRETSKNWLHKIANGYNKTYGELIDVSSTRKKIEAQLRSIVGVFELRRSNVLNLLDLPIEKEYQRRKRALEAKCAAREEMLSERQEKIKTDRQEEVKALASKFFPEDESEKWLNEPNGELNGRTPLEAAYSNSEGVTKAKDILYRIERKKRAEIEAEHWRKSLGAEAISQLGTQRSKAFLHGRDDDFQRQSAIDFCQCERTYGIALKKLKLWATEFGNKRRRT
ncbi:antitoxin Xre/MbcA/ParS toxin-binding domain-containing protein [Labrenzia sp. R5_0]|uniref:antitoxin Xre/MbcA/ParS toxin-binding domain-containing protein n=1 Tax=Labrenzia sp. R5_0 TaxID=2821108 RepID=UPI001ADBE94C|nr:antitoxin Xre/MbcA/ParS toxin-binding domain-containing protein [Labrenzia sp. R5_0]MBO9462474.1 DUF2384 domain-containing protein [Labrenzia sp. R5_0]